MLFHKKMISERLSGLDPVYYYIIPAAFFTFMGIAFGPFGSYLFEEVLIIPCVLFLRSMLAHPLQKDAKKAFVLSGILFVWFFLLQILRDLAYFDVYPFAPYFCSYFFAFPMAALLRDGEEKKGLKLFFVVFLAAGLWHVTATLLLFLDWIPAYFNEYHVFWDGGRLNSFWHPNMAACFLMFSIAACLAFLQSTTRKRTKLVFLACILFLLIPLALTNCRTVIILTGGLLGGAAFYTILKGRWKLLIPGLVVVCAMVLVVYTGSNRLYQAHREVLIAERRAEYLQQQAENAAPKDTTEEKNAAKPTVTTETEVKISLGGTSGQGTLANDITSLNSRTMLWNASLTALKANKLYPIIGVDNPGRHMSYFSTFPDYHTHNSWMEVLLGLGIPGLAIAMVFTVITLWNGIVILLKYPLDVWKRTTAMVTLCMMVASFMEPYLFLPPSDYHLFNFMFLLCAGYLFHWQQEDNRRMLQAVRKFLHI